MKLRRIMKRLIFVAAAALAVTTVSAPAFASTSPGLKKVHDPGRVTGTINGRCSYRDHGKLPDPRCTPGSIDPATLQIERGPQSGEVRSEVLGNRVPQATPNRSSPSPHAVRRESRGTGQGHRGWV